MNLEAFIEQHVIGRTESLFAADLAAHDTSLRQAIEGASVLVIGGAGTIGPSFIRALLPYRPARLVVVFVAFSIGIAASLWADRRDPDAEAKREARSESIA